MILAVLASFIISTEEANTFFTTPSWMPTEISSTRIPGSDDFIGFDYTVVTNASVVRTNVNCRVDKWYGANVTATMNAMLEREYFFNAGNFGDEWDDDVDGPKPNKSFWFEAIGGASPHLPFVYKSPFVAPYEKYEWAKNARWRTIESRRFVEHDNLQRLVSSLDPSQDEPMSSTYDLIYVGANRISKGGWKHWPKMIVSSTLMKGRGMEDLYDVAEFDSGFFSDRSWNKCIWSLGGLCFRGMAKTDHRLSHSADMIPLSLAFGWSTPVSDYNANVASIPTQQNTLSYTNVIESGKFNIEDKWDGVFPHRLTASPLAQCNQLLAAMDRNVVGTETLTATATVTKTFHHDQWTEYEPMNVAVSWDGAYGCYRVSSRVEPTGGNVVETNYVTIATNYSALTDSHFLFVSDAVENDSASFGISINGTGGVITESDIRIYSESAGFRNVGGTNLVEISNGGDQLVFVGNATRIYALGPSPSSSTNATAEFSHAQYNSYTYKRELANSELGEWQGENRPIYPSPSAFSSRVGSSVVNVISTEIDAKHYGDDFSESSIDANWRGRNKRYTMTDGDIANYLQTDGNDIRGNLESRYQSNRGFGIDNWESKIPINANHYSDIGDTTTNMFIEAGTELCGSVIISGGDWVYTQDGRLLTASTRQPVEPKEISYTSRYYAGGECAYKYDGVIKPNGERMSQRVRKVGIIETDWNFKSMKRED